MASPTPIVRAFQNVVVPAGDNFLPPAGILIPDGYTRLLCQFDVSAWQPADPITINPNYSLDGGATWDDQGGVTTVGGIHMSKDGVTPIWPGFDSGLPQSSGVMVRAHVIVPSSHAINGTITLS